MKEDEQVPAVDVFTPGQPKWIIVLVLTICGFVDFSHRTRWSGAVRPMHQARKRSGRNNFSHLGSRDGTENSLIILLEVIKRSSAVWIHCLETGWSRSVRQSQVSLRILGLWIVSAYSSWTFNLAQRAPFFKRSHVGLALLNSKGLHQYQKVPAFVDVRSLSYLGMVSGWW